MALANERVTITAGRESVVISWDERQELLERLRQVENTVALVGKLLDVGTRRPVELEPGDVDVLMDVLVAWQRGGGSPAPDGIRALAAMVWRVRGRR